MKKLKIGVFGAGRGVDLAKSFMLLNCEIVALCDFHTERLAEGRRLLGGEVATFTCFDDFIKTEMDAVILANYFHEHTPYAIQCMQRGIHVFSECISNGTMAEGVELIRAFEKCNAVYMLAENYPQMLFNREMHRLARGGSLGKILYAEGEYNHPSSPTDSAFMKQYNYFEEHWRNYLARTYYVTHSLGPIMWATGATPRRVTAFSVFAPTESDQPSASRVGDRASLIMTQNDDGSVFRFTGCAAFGAHHNAYRVCGTKGQIESVRGLSPQVMLRYNDWEKPEGAEEIRLYTPSWNDPDEEFIIRSGHGGGDYLTVRYFIECVRAGKQPEHPFDVHSAVAMSSVAILAHRSALEGGKPYEIPDFTREEWRVRYENDRLSPFPGSNGEAPTLPCCTQSDYAPTEAQLEGYRRLIKN
ncbi:MAG: Gfo/Idh/MocA family oxidoreductase [Clostridia bacterium]|nr:Gfo/Idh/MocA family oxidoreductase [Clostridia bacterium]